MHEVKKRAQMSWHERRGRGELFELVHVVEEVIDVCKAIHGKAIYGKPIYGKAIYGKAIYGKAILLAAAGFEFY